jgi:hypothetical protein
LEGNLFFAPGVGENCIGWNLASNEFMELERGGIEEAHYGYLNDSLLQIYKISLAAMGRSCKNVQSKIVLKW